MLLRLVHVTWPKETWGHNSCVTTAEEAVLDFQEKCRTDISAKQVSNLVLMRRRQQETCCYYTVAQLEGISKSPVALWLLLFWGFSFHNDVFGL